MDTKLMIQGTPNPNALKFILNTPVKTQGNYTYKSASECEQNLLAQVIFELNSAIKEVYFFDNYITVTQDGSADWDIMEETIQMTILENIKEHNPDFQIPVKEKTQTEIVGNPEEISRINTVLDETIRPALQMDGGDLKLISYQDNRLIVQYQGACGFCPSATSGTLMAIENILKDQYNPKISVGLADEY